MGHNGIALIASLNTKLQETLYAKHEIESCEGQGFIIDISTKTLVDTGDVVGPANVLARYGVTWEEFGPLDKAQSIETISNALTAVMPTLYAQGLFDAVIPIGGGQNARMTATAVKSLPFDVPRVVASSLACDRGTMGQYVGDKDIMVVHTVADISGLDYTTKTAVRSVCHTALDMPQHQRQVTPDSRRKIAATMLGITSKGVEGALRLLPDGTCEKTCFHANGIGGHCMEKLIEEGTFDLIADITLHELTCEVLGRYCTDANNRLEVTARHHAPMVVVPGALDILDFFIDKDGRELPDDTNRRKEVYHNSSIVHTKIYREEAVKLARALVGRLGKSAAPVTLILPDEDFCEAAVKGSSIYDPEAGEALISTIKPFLEQYIKIIEVRDNINSDNCRKAVAAAIMNLV